MVPRSLSERALLRKTVLLVCSPLKAAPLAAGLQSMGAEVRPFQAISVRPAKDLAALDAALFSLDDYSWIIFTSAYAVVFFDRRMRELGVSADKFAHLRVCAVGPATAKKARESGIPVSLVPEEFVAEGVLQALEKKLGSLQELAGKRILMPRAKEAREILPAELAAAGATVDVAVCYETVQAEIDPDLVADVRNNPPDLIVFTSSSNVAHFAAILGAESARRLLTEATIAVLGPVTAKTVGSFGKQPEILPRENTIPSLIESIRTHFQR